MPAVAKENAESFAVIAAAVAPLKDMATQEAVRASHKTIDSVLEDLSIHDWDLSRCAPIPNSGVGRAAYKSAMEKRSLYQSLAAYVETKLCRRPSDPCLLQKSESLEALFIKRQIENAVHSYDLYVSKLNTKVGDVLDASLEVSSSVWGSSVLTVTKPDGSVHRWKTQVIVNCSVLGKNFNQWPTRLIK